MVRKLIIANLCLLSVLLATAVVNAWTHGGSIAQSILTSLQVTANPPSLGSADNRYAVIFNCSTDSSNINPNFSNSDCFEMTSTTTNGNNVNAGGGNVAKTTFSPFSLYSLNYGAGQRINAVNEQHCYGAGDCSAWGTKVTYAGGPVNGDEGQAFSLFAPLSQQTNLDTGTVASVTRTTCNTTVTQAVTKNIAAQAVTVASTTGCNINDWVVIEQQIINGSYTAEAVKITAVGGGTITGVFTLNHINGTTVTPATVIAVTLTAGVMAQGRVLVNTGSASTYATGSISAIGFGVGNGSTFTGSGTTWANNMVGGNSSNVGCIAMTADDYNDGSNYGGNTLKSWYQLTAINSTTSLNAWSFTTTGDTTYVGNGPGAAGHGGSGGYIVRPCIQVLRIDPNLQTVIAETTATTWTVGDTVELAITPYPDVSGFNYSFNKFTPGGTTRSGMLFRNNGPRVMTAGITLDNSGGPKGNLGQDYGSFAIGYYCLACWTGIQISQAADVGIQLESAFSSGITFTGTIIGTTLTTTSVSSNGLGAGEVIDGVGVTAHTYITAQIGGTPGGAGTYTVAISGCPSDGTHCTQNVGPIAMQAGSIDKGGKVAWGNGAYIMPNTANQGMDFGTLLAGGGLLQSKSSSVVASGTLASLNFQGSIGTTASTFAALGTCSSGRAGQQVYISDSNTSTLNANITGSGATPGLALCNGSNWTYH